MIPFVRTRWELEACLEAIDAHPLGRQRGLHRWVMAEVPSVVFRIPEYAALADGVSIGSNDLTQLVLGVDRDSEICAELFDESDEAVLDAIKRIIEACSTAGITRRCVARRPRTARSSPTSSCVRDHVDLGEPRRGTSRSTGDRPRRAPDPARPHQAEPEPQPMISPVRPSRPRGRRLARRVYCHTGCDPADGGGVWGLRSHRCQVTPVSAMVQVSSPVVGEGVVPPAEEGGIGQGGLAAPPPGTAWCASHHCAGIVHPG